MTLVEVMVAFTILIITLVPLTYLLTSVVASAADARQRQSALQLADSWLEVLSNSSLPTDPTSGAIITNTPQNPATFPGITQASTPIPKSTLAGTNFTVTADFTTQSVANQGESDLCSSGQPPSPSHPAVILLQVTVSWNGGHSSVTDTTAVNYPQPGLQTQGFLAVQLTNSGTTDVNGNSAATRLSAIPVTLKPASGTTLTLYPDQNGCVFAQVPVGSYTVSAAQPSSGTPDTFNGYSGSPSFITTANSTGQSVSTSVSVTNETIVQLDPFDEGITSSVSYASAAGVDSGVDCPGTTAITCVATGNGASGASAAWGGSGSTWSSTSFSGISNLNQVACTSGGSPTCVGVGNASVSAVIRTTSSGLGTTNTDSNFPSGVTALSQVACPSANGCYAIGTTALGPVLLAGAVGQTPATSDIWAAVAPTTGTAFTTLSSLACPTTSTCEVTGSATVGSSPATPMILRLDGDPALLASNASWTPTLTTDTPPGAVKSLGTIICPTTTLCLSLAVGDLSSTTDATVITGAIGSPTSPTDLWAAEANFPTGTPSLTGISCTTASCVAVGTKSGSPVTQGVWTADLGQSPHDWAAAATFPTVAAITGVACGQPSGSDTADCVVAASVSGTGELVTGSEVGGSWSWNPISNVAGSTVLYFTGVSCESAPSASRATCAAAGATSTGPFIVTSSSGPSGTWSNQTPSSLPGAVVGRVPVETAPTSSSTWASQVAWSNNGTNATALPNVLYPQPLGYFVAAGDCLATTPPVSAAKAALNAAPGGTASPTVPLDVLPLQVTTSAGVPLAGATVTLTSTSCSTADTYTLPATDAFGFTRTSVPFGTYTYTVRTSAGVTSQPTVTIGGVTTPSVTLSLTTANAIGTAIKASNGTTSTVTTYLPGPIVVTSS